MTTDSLLLDTHVWFRTQSAPRLLRPTSVPRIAEAASRHAIFVSVISVWELALMERGGRLFLEGGVSRWVDEALSKPGISLLPYTPRIAIEAVNLPAPMHKDPSDRILIASALVEGLTIVTSDKAMLAFARSTALLRLRPDNTRHAVTSAQPPTLQNPIS